MLRLAVSLQFRHERLLLVLQKRKQLKPRGEWRDQIYIHICICKDAIRCEAPVPSRFVRTFDVQRGTEKLTLRELRGLSAREQESRGHMHYVLTPDCFFFWASGDMKKAVGRVERMVSHTISLSNMRGECGGRRQKESTSQTEGWLRAPVR